MDDPALAIDRDPDDDPPFRGGHALGAGFPPEIGRIDLVARQNARDLRLP
ncbi:hypothetical protein [Enterovirga rhinocerotis]|nr:hypothetical protein [Enterovirga rhinocerotis]